MAKKPPHKKPSLTKAQRREYDKLRQQTSRAKRQAKKADKGFNYGKVRGKVNKNRKARTDAYKKLTEANRELIEFRKKHGIGKPKEPKKRYKRKTPNVKAKTLSYTMPAFQFEGQKLTDYIKAKVWKKFIFENETVSGRKPASDIYEAYDRNRNLAYMELLATSVFVNVTENYGNKTISFEFIS